MKNITSNPGDRARMRGVVSIIVFALAAGCGDPIIVQGDAPGYMRVVVGELDRIGETVDTLARRTRLFEPGAVAFQESSGMLYAFDRGSRRSINGIQIRLARIMKVDSRGRLTVEVNLGGCATTVTSCLQGVAQAAWAQDGTLLLADPFGQRVFRYEPAAKRLTVVAGTGVDAFAPDGARAADSPLRRPQGVAVGEDGRIYISEEGASRVRYIDAQGALRTLAGTGEAGYSGNGAAATSARLSAPANLVVRGSRVYVADAGNHTVRVIDLGTGIIEGVAGTGGPGFSGDGGSGLSAQLAKPHGLALSPDGNTLYVSERENHRVRAVFLPTGSIETFAGTGSPVAGGARGPAGTISLNGPTGMAAAERGFLYVADTGHSVIWRSTITF